MTDRPILFSAPSTSRRLGDRAVGWASFGGRAGDSSTTFGFARKRWGAGRAISA